MPQSPDQASPTALTAPELQELDRQFRLSSLHVHPRPRGLRAARDGRGPRLPPHRQPGATATWTRWPASGASTSATGTWRWRTRSGRRSPASPTTTRSRRWPTMSRPLLAEKLVTSAPVPMARVFFGNSGSDANDTNLKLVWYYNNVLGRPEKKKIISRIRGYHGVTVATAGPHRAGQPPRWLRRALADDPPRPGSRTACGRPSRG